jgi:hypothetical protein
MRKICFSLSTRRTVSLIARFEARSWPEGLFQHDACRRRVQPRRRQLFAGDGEQGWRRRQVHHHRVGIALAQHVGQALVVGRLRQVHADEVQQRGEALELLRRGPLGQVHFGEARVDQRAVLLVAEVVAGHPDDAAALRQGAVAEGLEQRRHQLAPGEIASAAEQNQVETHGRGPGYFEAIHCNLVS